MIYPTTIKISYLTSVTLVVPNMVVASFEVIAKTEEDKLKKTTRRLFLMK
jgi:hypothetical protein